MKQLLIAIVSLVILSTTAYADDISRLRMKIAGPINDNRYFLCVTNAGCVSILAGNKGKAFPIMGGNINNIFTTNITTRQMSTQPLPASCQISVDEGKTLTVSGRLVKGQNGNTFINNLHCTVS